MARNRFFDIREDRLYSNTRECIFISHQKNDAKAAKKIADYIINAGIDVYFDEYDPTIKLGNPQSVVNSIRTGINKSTIMLCLLTRNSMSSKWMPWEIGYGYDQTNVIGLTDIEIHNQDLPEYLQVVPVLRGISSLNDRLSSIIGKPKQQLINEQRMFSASSRCNPLYNILQWDL